MQNFSSRTQGLIAINVAAFIFGSAALYGKLDVSPFWLGSMRAMFAALTLFIIIFAKKRFMIPPKHLWSTILITGTLLATHWLGFFGAVQLANIPVATLTFSTFPLFTVLIEAFHHKRKPHREEIIASTAIIIAVGLLMNPAGSNVNFLSILVGLSSAVSYAFFWHKSKILSANMPTLLVSAYQNLMTFLVLVPFLPFVMPAPSHISDWVGFMLLGIVNTALMLQLYLYALKRISHGTCSGFIALEPVYALSLSALIFGDKITIWVAISTFLIIGASFILLGIEKKSETV